MSKVILPNEVFPAWFLKRWFLFATLLILMIVGMFRMYKLASVPAGMTWDEAAIGYNGYAIAHTRRDEWLQRLPVSFKSFGDYKAPLAIYINAISTTVFGLNLWAVRVPFAVFGVLTVLGGIVLVRRLTNSNLLALFAGFLMSTSPWLFHFARAGFESGIALCFLIWGVLCLTQFFNNALSTRRKYFFLGIAVFDVVMSMYAYHSAKIVAPLLAVSVVLLFKPKISDVWKPFLVGFSFAVLLLWPMLTDTLQGNGAERFQQTSILGNSSDVSLLQKSQIVGQNFLTHLTPQFLIFGQTTTFRHGDGVWGVLLMSEFFLIVTGCYFGIKQFTRKYEHHNNLFFIGIPWIVIGLLPAAIGMEVPHANRSLLAYPGFLLVAVFAVQQLFEEITKIYSVDYKNILRIIVGMTLLTQGLLFFSYQKSYFTEFAQRSQSDFYFGYDRAMQYAIRYEDEVDKILFTSEYGQPYIYALFFRQTNPIWYQGGSLIKYEFTDKISVADIDRKNTIVIATPKQIDPSLADEVVIAPDGTIKFVMIKTR